MHDTRSAHSFVILLPFRFLLIRIGMCSVPLSLERVGACFSLGASPRGLNNTWPDGAVGRRGQVAGLV